MHGWHKKHEQKKNNTFREKIGFREKKTLINTLLIYNNLQD